MWGGGEGGWWCVCVCVRERERGGDRSKARGQGTTCALSLSLLSPPPPLDPTNLTWSAVPPPARCVQGGQVPARAAPGRWGQGDGRDGGEDEGWGWGGWGRGGGEGRAAGVGARGERGTAAAPSRPRGTAPGPDRRHMTPLVCLPPWGLRARGVWGPAEARPRAPCAPGPPNDSRVIFWLGAKRGRDRARVLLHARARARARGARLGTHLGRPDSGSNALLDTLDVCARCRLPVAGAAASPRQPSPRPPAIGGPSPSLSSLSLPPSRPTSVHPPTARAGRRSHPAPSPALPPPPPAQAHGRKQGGDGREGRARRQHAGCTGGGRRGAGW